MRSSFQDVACVSGSGHVGSGSGVTHGLPSVRIEIQPDNTVSGHRSLFAWASSTAGGGWPGHVSGCEGSRLHSDQRSSELREGGPPAAGLSGEDLPRTGIDEYVSGDHAVGPAFLQRASDSRLGVPCPSFEVTPGLLGFEHLLGGGDPLAGDLGLLLEPRNNQVHERFKFKSLSRCPVFKVGQDVDGLTDQPANDDAVVLARHARGDDQIPRDDASPTGYRPRQSPRRALHTLRDAFRPVTRSGTGKSVSILTAATKDDLGAGRDVTREAVMRGLGGDAERGANPGVHEIVTEAIGADELVDDSSGDETGASDEQRPITACPRRE